MIICQACEVDPVVTLREIIDAARAYEVRERQNQITDDLIDRIAAHPEDYDVAANIDENRDVESETPDD